MLLKYCSSTVHAVSLILLDTPQDPTQLTLMAVERKHTHKHWEKAKPQVQTCFRYCMWTCAGAVPAHTHTGWKNGAKESGHTFISEARFPLTLSTIAHSPLPQCYSQMLSPLKSSSWPPCTVKALNSSDFSSLRGNPLSSFLPNEAKSLPNMCISLSPQAASRDLCGSDVLLYTHVSPSRQG